MSIRVDFPEPDGPAKPIRLFSGISKDKLLITLEPLFG